MREHLDLVGFFTLGLLGGFGHCLGMCGPFVLYVSRRFAPAIPDRAAVLGHQAVYGLGRVLTYGALGAIAGAAGSAVELAASLTGVQRVASLVAGVFLILFAAASLANRLPALTRGGGPLFGWLADLMRRRAPDSALATGLVLGLLPCGLLYGALIAAAAQASPLRGAAGLLLFGLGTLPAMLALSLVDELVARHRAWLNRLSLVLLLALGGWFVWQGLPFA